MRCSAFNLCCAVAIFVSSSVAARAVEDIELMGPDLQRRPARLVSLGAGRLSYFDTERRLRAEAVEDLVSLRFDRKPLTPTEPALTFADGQVLYGTFSGVGPKGLLQWKTETFGVMEIPLDRVMRMAGPAHAGVDAEPSVEHDTILLANGDLMHGLIDTLQAGGPRLLRDGIAVDLPWSAVASVALANPVIEDPGLWVVLVHGHRLRIQNPRLESGRLRATSALGKDLDLPLETVRELIFATRYRLVPVASLKHVVAGRSDVFGLSWPPQFDAFAAQLHAPLSLQLMLPSGAVRFAAEASIDAEDLDWADLTMSIANDRNQKLFEQRLNAATPRAAVNVSTKGTRQLTIDLAEGINGPIRDRLKLGAAAVLIDQR